MADDAFRITTVATDDLCLQLDCRPETDELDGALADAGYVRLDHGLEPGSTIAIMAFSPPAGRDPGHRAPAIALATCLLHVIHADGKPEPARLRRAAETALETIHTDPTGERIVTALAAYAGGRDPGVKRIDVHGPFSPAPSVVAKVVYEAARNRNVITDVALERAEAIGTHIPRWREMLYSHTRAEEPVVRVRRHSAEDYEKHGIEPEIAELISWIRANPNVEVEEFVRYAAAVGIEPKEAGMRIATALIRNPLLGSR